MSSAQNVDTRIWEVIREKYDTNKVKMIKGRVFLFTFDTSSFWSDLKHSVIITPNVRIKFVKAREIYFDMSLSKEEYEIEIIDYYYDGEYGYTDYELV